MPGQKASTTKRRGTDVCSLVFAMMAALLFQSVAAHAETRALLIGVSDYEADNVGITDLKGPANDVRLMRDVLKARGVTDIRILADGVAGGVRPTRDAILAAFDTLTADVAAGDFVYIHFSGHGTRQPDQNGDETDGYDEVFLAIDSTRAPVGDPQIPNAIVDDEIGAAVRRIRAQGADVWLVIDSCHAGTGIRAAASNVAPRFVDPAALGVEVTSRAPAEPGPDGATVEDLPGGYLAFYAARSSELAREVNMKEGENGWYGLFTAKLAARLQTAEAISFRQLFQAALTDLNDSTLPGVARLQTPSWEGGLIDAAVFGGRDTAGLRRFRVVGDEIMAGLLHGFSEGTLVALVNDATAPADAILGYAQLTIVEPTRAVLRPVAETCVPRAIEPCADLGALPADAGFAQVVGRPIDLVVRLAPPLDLSTGNRLAPGTAPMSALEQAIAAASAAGHGLRLDPASYDVDVSWDGERLWFGRRSAIDSRPVGLSWHAEGALDLTEILIRIERAETFARLFDAVGGEASILNPNPVTVTASLAAVDVAALSEAGVGETPRQECRRAHRGLDAEGMALGLGADVKQCDVLHFSAQGVLPGAWDVNRVYIDAQYCVRVEHQLIEGARLPRKLGPGMTMCSDCPSGYSAGEERLFVVVSEVRDNTEPFNLSGALETCGAAGPARGNATSTLLRTLLESRSRRPDTRGSFGSGFEPADIWIERFTWRVLPRDIAFTRLGRTSATGE